jgi:hypothetical protein
MLFSNTDVIYNFNFTFNGNNIPITMSHKHLGSMENIHPNYSTGVARVPTVVSEAFYYRLDVCNLCKLLFQTQFLSNYPTIIIYSSVLFQRNDAITLVI